MDYYSILEVSRDATGEEIKKSYRRLSKKYHPDANPGNAEAEKRFKDISEAYAVLGDQKKRQEYDEKNLSETKKTEKNGHGTVKKKTGASYTGFDPGNLSHQFEQFFGFHPKSDRTDMQQEKKRGTNPIDMTDMFEKFMGIHNEGEKRR